MTSLAYARYHHNHTILADGSVLITGGTTDNDGNVPVYPTELYDPGSNPPTTMTRATLAPSPTPRMYHSSALLLPDGRVLSMGGQGGDPVVNQQNGDFFYPPYLFDDADNLISDSQRPAAQAAVSPSLVGTGATFTVTGVTPGTGASNIVKASLIRPASVTHANNFDQRYLPLVFNWNASTNECIVTSPSFAEEAPPGYYMLFFVNDQGHPSKAKFLRIWGIEDRSIVRTGQKFCQQCVSTFKLTVSWNTNLATDPGVKDRLDVYPPGAACTGPSTLYAEADPLDSSRKTHRVEWQGGCAVGTWRYVIKSTSGQTVSTVACREIVVGSCPSCGPCDLE